MGCITKTVGRLLFVTILLSSAYLHLSKPQNYTSDLSSNYSQFHQIFTQNVKLGVFPPAELINWNLWSKVFGLLELITAILIVFGDCWGGFFLFLNLLVSGAFDYQDIANIVQWEQSRQFEFGKYLLFVGASLALMTCTKRSKSCPASPEVQPSAASK